jgi:pimeloyl-ACP methyl ester carboxylesterase
MGLGMAATGWWRTIRVLSRTLRVIAFDNRGAGRSEAPPGPYTVAQMARDALAVLDAAEAPRAHVYGISLGGMIAQEIALEHPNRVISVVLGATSPGGADAVPPDEDTLGFLERRTAMPAEEGIWASVPYLYGAPTRRHHGGRIGQDTTRRLRFPIGPDGYRAQVAAAWGHDASGRLGGIDAPTLVVHGLDDRMILPANGRLLAERIPGASLQLWEGAGHLYTTDEPRADREVLRFLIDAAVRPEDSR